MKNHSENNFQNEDLEKSAPLLHELKSKMSGDAGFQVPEDYFETLSSSVMSKIESIPNLEEVSSANPFKTPEGYFDSLPSIVQQKIIDQKKPSVADLIAELFSNPVPKITIALASIILVIFFSFKYFTRTVKVDYVNAEPETEQLESFYLSQLDEIVLTEAYTEEQDHSIEQENEIENYLLENNVDLNLISEHL